MIYLTQLIFIDFKFAEEFLAFENFAIPLMYKYKGKIIYRIRPSSDNFIYLDTEETPYEVHFISFPNEEFFTAFMKDDSRLKLFHLKEKSVKVSILIKGENSIRMLACMK